MNPIFRKLFFATTAVFLAGSLSSCASFHLFQANKGEKKVQKDKKTTAEKKVGEALVKAIVKNNADAFVRELPENLVKEFGKKDFEKTRGSMLKELGTPVSYSYLRNMAHPLADISLWVIRFERKVKNGQDGKEKTVVMEVLFRVVSGQLQGKDTLLSFNFY